jgi:hypothetical protein
LSLITLKVRITISKTPFLKKIFKNSSVEILAVGCRASIPLTSLSDYLKDPTTSRNILHLEVERKFEASDS